MQKDEVGDIDFDVMDVLQGLIPDIISNIKNPFLRYVLTALYFVSISWIILLLLAVILVGSAGMWIHEFFKRIVNKK